MSMWTELSNPARQFMVDAFLDLLGIRWEHKPGCPYVIASRLGCITLNLEYEPVLSFPDLAEPGVRVSMTLSDASEGTLRLLAQQIQTMCELIENGRRM